MDGRTGTEEGRVQAIFRAILEVKPEIVILNCLDSAFEAVRRARRKLKNLRLVVTNHGNFPRQAAALLGHRDEIDLAVCIGRQSIPMMSMSPFGFPPERLVHLPNAVSVSATTVPRQPSSHFRIGYAGRLDSEERKRIKDIIPFFTQLNERLENTELWIAGNGNLERDLQQQAGKFGPKVHFFGALNRQQLCHDFYPHLDVLLNFSTNEAFGLSMAEAMSNKVPVVTSLFYGLEDEKLILPGINSLTFPIGDVQAASNHVYQLAVDSNLRQTLAKNAYSHIEDNFSPENSGKAWTAALQNCLVRPVAFSHDETDFRGAFRMLLTSAKEKIRRWTGRRFEHASAGEEWPHYRCNHPELLRHVIAIAESDTKAGIPTVN